ncbi:Reverse transcriptase domain-containing protein [Aphis craccivora]|uniref:Reverse transcriptase domain-containing protein n=1 Tax=Aphis craccivora TaxID=307492 RepID=A0A6G0Z271_APHCR|nr:Reverse transcriptase domain-containing protein [Aphis craccivora]
MILNTVQPSLSPVVIRKAISTIPSNKTYPIQITKSTNISTTQSTLSRRINNSSIITSSSSTLLTLSPSSSAPSPLATTTSTDVTSPDKTSNTTKTLFVINPPRQLMIALPAVNRHSRKILDSLLESIQTITINDQLIQIRRLINSSKRIVISNVCPSIPNQVITDVLKNINITPVSEIAYLKADINIDGYEHILSFRVNFLLNMKTRKISKDLYHYFTTRPISEYSSLMTESLASCENPLATPLIIAKKIDVICF